MNILAFNIGETLMKLVQDFRLRGLLRRWRLADLIMIALGLRSAVPGDRQEVRTAAAGGHRLRHVC